MVKPISENIGDYKKFVTPSIGHGFDKGDIKTYGKPVKNLAKIIAGNIHRILEQFRGEGKINNKIVYEKIIREFEDAKNTSIPQTTLTKIKDDVGKIFKKLNKSSEADKLLGKDLETKLQEFIKNHQPKTSTKDESKSKDDETIFRDPIRTSTSERKSLASTKERKSQVSTSTDPIRTSTSERKSLASTKERKSQVPALENTTVNKEITTEEPSSAQDVKTQKKNIQFALRGFLEIAKETDKNLTNTLGQWVGKFSTDNQILSDAFTKDFSDFENDKFLETVNKTLETVLKGLKQNGFITLDEKGLPDKFINEASDTLRLYHDVTQRLILFKVQKKESQV